MKRIIAALTALMLLMPSALAETWITVSSWAYNDVSNFKKAGMLPESFDDINDFTQPVTRLQTAQILYSAISNVADDLSSYVWSSDYFSDTDDKSALELLNRGIMEGDFSGEYDENGTRLLLFYPDRQLTREEMAVILDRTVEYYFINDQSEISCQEPADYSEISVWAQASVLRMMDMGIISGMDDNMFVPKGALTIEQAISLVYRLYSYLPTGQEADGARLDGKTEETVQTYPNGIEETKKGDMLYLKQDGQTLIEFETDIYSNIYCETVDIRIFAAAQNFYGKTDIYDVAEKTITAKLPYPVYSVDSEYITVKSSVIGPFCFGLYDWNGNKVTDVNYSLKELQQLKSNGFSGLTAEYKSPSGIIYFSDQNDGGSLCAIDSNGENKRKLSDKNCVSRIYCLNDRLYFIAEENGIYSLCSIKTDGTGEIKINDYTKETHDAGIVERYSEYSGTPNDEDILGAAIISKTNDHYDLSRKYNQIISDGDWIYYLSDNKYYADGEYNSICRFKIADNNTIEKEQITDEIISTGSTIQFKNGKMYFLDEKKLSENSYSCIYSSDLYCFDGNSISQLNGDLNVLEYCFFNDSIILFTGDDYDECKSYIINSDGSDPQPMEEINKAKERYIERMEKIKEARDSGETIEWRRESYTLVYDEFSDDTFTVYAILTYTGNNSEKSIFTSDANGNITQLTNKHVDILARYGDILVFCDSDPLASGCRIIRYDMNTGEQRIAADNYYNASASIYLRSYYGKYAYYYDRNLNIWRYDIENDITEEIAPNSGTYKYGAVYDMFGKNDGMYKLDTDGNYCLVTNKEYAANCLYVENGTGKAIHF